MRLNQPGEEHPKYTRSLRWLERKDYRFRHFAKTYKYRRVVPHTRHPNGNWLVSILLDLDWGKRNETQ